MHERSDTIVTHALARLRAEDERLGGDAEAALNSLTWDEGLETITQYGLQRFLWYELPRKWMTNLEGKRHLALALGRLLDLVGLARCTAICRSPETDAVLGAWERDDREGFAAFRRAEERSGLHPPDLPELTWGPVMGMQEAGAFWSTAAGLELAVAGGELRPGGRGWRAAQQAIARRHLTAARPELDGRTWLEVVLAERVEEWGDSRSQPRRALAEPLLGRLRGGPVQVPARATEVVAPLRWLLARASEGIALTQKGNLARSVVIEAVERFGWQPLPNPPRGEDDVFELWVLRDLARNLGAVRRSGRRLVATRAGRALAGDDFGATVTELALALLLDANEMLQAELVKRVHAAVVGEGWHDRVTGRLPDPEAVRRQLAEPLRLLGVLGLSREGGDWRARTVGLTGVGRATALEALRSRHRAPSRPVPRMSGQPTAPASRPRRKPILGPEAWQEVAGRTWSHWDLWYCLVLVRDFDSDWAAFAEELWRRRSPYLLTLDEEAKVSHLDDLRARLTDAGLAPADLVGGAAGDRKLLAKARGKVLDQPLDRGRDHDPGDVDHSPRAPVVPGDAWPLGTLPDLAGASACAVHRPGDAGQEAWPRRLRGRAGAAGALR